MHKSRKFLYRRVRRLNPPNMICLEIGVWKGENSNEMLDILHPSKLYLVDPWRFYPEYQRKKGSNNKQKEMDVVYEQVKENYKNNNKVIVIRDMAHNVVNLFEDNSIDFIYIDGNHKKEFVRKDLELYYPKLKVHGYIGGDDYVPITNQRKLKVGLREAVDEFIEKYNVKVVLRGNDFQFLMEKLI